MLKYLISMCGSSLATRHAKSSPQPLVSSPVLFNPIASVTASVKNIYRESKNWKIGQHMPQRL